MRTEKANYRIRAAAKSAGVVLWQIAMQLGVSEATMTRKMRTEMSEEEKARIFSIIENLKAEQEGK